VEPDRCPRNQERETHYKQVGIDPRQHFRRIRHASEVFSDINRISSKKRRDNPE
jgi:curved DNA-binding protein CbpA